MSSLRQHLLKKGYTRIKLNTTLTNHLELKATVNGNQGSFLLDTGASSSCIDNTHVQHFDLLTTSTEITASGAGASGLKTLISDSNSIHIEKWSLKNLKLVVLDLSHVNNALIKYKSETVHGILGADILKKGKGIIDYQYKCLYLK